MSDQKPPEPIFNVPWPALVVAGVVLLPWFVIKGLSQETLMSLALIPDDVWHGRLTGLVTALFVPSSLSGAGFNAVFALAFGAPLARLMGVNGRGGGIFFLFYLTCGVLAGLGYAAVRPESVVPVVGAAGAVAGLMGGASRTLGFEPGVLGVLFAPRAMALALGWVIINLVMAVMSTLLNLPPGALPWESQLVGFVAGAVLVEPFARWARVQPQTPETD